MVDPANNEFSHVEALPTDPILNLFVAYMKDDHPDKVNLGIGAYRDHAGVPYVFDVVREAEKKLVEEKLNKEYLPIDGHYAFTEAARKLVFGETSPLVTNGSVFSTQTIAGSGALAIGFDFLRRTKPAPVYITDVTWANHIPMIEHAGFQVRKLRYYNAETKSIDYEGYVADLRAATPGSIVLVQGCCHNPLGVDPTEEQWKEIAVIMKERNLFPFFDIAYPGFGTGDVDRDLFSLRYFIEQGF